MTRREWMMLVPAARSAGSTAQLAEAFAYVRTTTKHGGLVVQQGGRVRFEQYFGRANADSAPNLASVGKSFTSVAAGILQYRRPDLFPDGLATPVYSERLLPGAALRLNDDRKRNIRLGQLLTMTSGIRGNSPGMVLGKPVPVEPPGLDGWQAMRDQAAIECDLWCNPGAGYSYATAGVHLVSMIVRHVSGMELQAYLDQHLAQPLGWGKWGFGYRRPEIDHTPGGGGIELRARDILAFGEIMLRLGRWRNRQVIPSEYVRLCGRRSPFNPHSPYSLQFDVNADGQVETAPRDAYWKTGSGGHCLYIVPSLDLVIWKLGGRDDQYGFPPDGKPFRPSDDPGTAARKTLAMVVAAMR